YLAALEARRVLQAQLAAVFAEVDVILGPTVGVVAPTLQEAADPAIAARLVQHTRLANVTGVPAASLPLPTGGLPVGLQVLAPTDGALLAAAAWIEERLR